MKKIFNRSLMVVALITPLLMAGCQKDTSTLRARIGHFGDDNKVYMSGDNYATPTWSNGDTIWIDHANTTDNSYILSNVNTSGEAKLVVPVATSYCALYPYGSGSISGTTATITIPNVQPYYEKNNKQVVNAPMAACTLNDQPGTITFHNLGALLAINIECNIVGHTSMDVEEVIVTSTDQSLSLWGTGTVDLSDPTDICEYEAPSGSDPFTVRLKKLPGSTNTKLFTLNATGTTNRDKTVYVYIPAVPQGVNNRFTIQVKGKTEDNEPISLTRTQKSTSGGNLRLNMMASVYFPMRIESAPRGAVPNGKFTVNSDGDKVYFAAGNLQYKPDESIWRIAPHQYDYIGGSESGTTGNVSGSYNNGIYNGVNVSSNANYGKLNTDYHGWIDLFGWGTSGYNNTDNDSYASRYQPYAYLNSPTVNATYNAYGYGPSTNANDNNSTYNNFLQGVNANYDWGVYHSNITGNTQILQYNGQSVAADTIWRVLTKAEWLYLLKTRVVKGSTDVHHTWSAVTYQVSSSSSLSGILIYPDGYVDQVTNSTNTHATINAVPEGCVFLPITRQRTGNTCSINNKVQGFYWTSQSQDETAHSNYAWGLFCNPANAGNVTFQSYYRCYGNAVRLVANVNQ